MQSLFRRTTLLSPHTSCGLHVGVDGVGEGDTLPDVGGAGDIGAGAGFPHFPAVDMSV